MSWRMVPGAKARSANHSICISKGLKPPASTEYGASSMRGDIFTRKLKDWKHSGYDSIRAFNMLTTCGARPSKQKRRRSWVAPSASRIPLRNLPMSADERSSRPASALTHVALNVHCYTCWTCQHASSSRSSTRDMP